MFTVRPATCQDLPAIVLGEQRYMREQEPAQLTEWNEAIARNLALWIANLEHALVAEDDDGAVAGYLIWSVAGREATVITVHVIPERRHAGLAGRLLTDMLDAARPAGLSTVRLGVLAGNPARALYERLGYVETGVDGDYVLYELAVPRGTGPAERAAP